jgi:tRNA U34 2-thiouridine synthase MnmA/TrmU
MKAVGLFSGGLDSTLSLKIIKEQGIEVVALHFFSPFCTCNKKGCGVNSVKLAEYLGVQLKIEFLGEEYLSVVKNPKYGYGKNLNPCIDCRILLLKKAKEFMHKIGASFVITGEVLGQRPKSQHRRALRIIEKESGLEGLILRPLSAKLLSPTIPEKKGWVDREKLLNFYGRTRKPQMELANIFGIRDYPCPSGGCLLTDPSFCRRVEDLLKYDKFTLEEVRLLKIGRHFRINPHFKLIVGRDERENKLLLDSAKKGDWCFIPKDTKGALGVGKGIINDDIKKLSSQIIARYCSSSDGSVSVVIKNSDKEKEEIILAEKLKDSEIEKFRI